MKTTDKDLNAAGKSQKAAEKNTGISDKDTKAADKGAKAADKKKAIIIIAVIVIFFAIALVTKLALAPAEAEGSAASRDGEVIAGIAKIESLSERSITDTEEKLRMIEKFERLEQIQEGNFKVIYDDSVIMGDSHAEGFASYGLLDSTRVIAVKGRNLKKASEDIEKAAALRPSYVFLNYGMNDAMIYGKNVDKFITDYTDFITELETELPDAHIVVCSIFEAADEACESEPLLTNIPIYNIKLKQMCESLGLTFVDTTDLLTGEYYEPDHVHTNAEYHKVWLRYVATESGLLDVDSWYWEG